ncbi:hypothetical protein D3C80_512100 [compost metagenome]
MVLSSKAWPCCCGQPGMSLARMSRANTLLPHTLDSASLRKRALPSWFIHFCGEVVTAFSISAANAWLPSGARVTPTPAISPPWSKARRDISRLDMVHPLGSNGLPMSNSGTGETGGRNLGRSVSKVGVKIYKADRDVNFTAFKPLLAKSSRQLVALPANWTGCAWDLSERSGGRLAFTDSFGTASV